MIRDAATADVNKVFPQLDSKESFYQFYKNQTPSKNVLNCIKIDVPRAEPGKKSEIFTRPMVIGGSNPLFNILVAYANFDQEVGYCQGLNIMGVFILKCMA